VSDGVLFDAASTAPVPWWKGRMLGIDCETTREQWDTAGPDVNEERICEVSVALVGGGQETWSHSWLINPGFSIPPESTAIHGISDADVAGAPVWEDVAEELLDVIAEATDQGVPLVAYNAAYDCTVLDREFKRFTAGQFAPGEEASLSWVPNWGLVRVVDPMIVDRMLDTFRKGSRKLPNTVAIWNARAQRLYAAQGREWRAGELLERERSGPHEAAKDAIAACRLAWLLCATGEVYSYDRPIRTHDRPDREMLAVQARWDREKDDLALLHEWQRAWRYADQERLREKWRAEGNPRWEGVRPEWPVYPEGVKIG
jgi:DNA polymerase-3 subunit epsilon